MKKAIMIILLACSITILPLHGVIAQDTCPADLEAAEKLMEEESEKVQELKLKTEALKRSMKTMEGVNIVLSNQLETCQTERGWVTLVKDKTFMSAAIGSTLLLLGGVAGLFIAPL